MLHHAADILERMNRKTNSEITEQQVAFHNEGAI